MNARFLSGLGLLFLAFSQFPSPLPAQQLLNRLKAGARELGRDAIVRQSPRADADTEIEKLAREIDWLEAHIDKFGSVAVKQPDVWGESRLTKFRGEYEQQMASRMGAFQLRDNASILRSDSAFLSAAFNLEGALRAPASSTTVIQNAAASKEAGAEGETATSLFEASAPKDISQSLSITGLGGSDRLKSTALDNLEVTEELNQRSRYLHHLQQLRRINAGDDTSDAPGYSLNLVRIPVSVSPGRETRRGYAAEVTITARPHLSDTLLPETFRSMVINDIVDQLALPVLKLAESPELAYSRKVQEFDLEYNEIIKRIEVQVELAKMSERIDVATILDNVFQQRSTRANLQQLSRMGETACHALEILEATSQKAEARRKSQAAQNNIRETVARFKFYVLIQCDPNCPTPECRAIIADLTDDEMIRIANFSEDAKNQSTTLQKVPARIADKNGDIRSTFSEIYRDEWNFRESKGRLASRNSLAIMLQRDAPENRDSTLELSILKEAANVGDLFKDLFDFYTFDKVQVNPVSRRRRSTMPIPQVMLEGVVGRVELVEIALGFRDSYRGQMVAWNEAPNTPPIHLADVRQYLQASLEGAYRMLAQTDNREILRSMIEPGLTPNGLAEEIRLAHLANIDLVRNNFRSHFHVTRMAYDQPEPTASIMRSLAWPVVVEMALLNDQLNKDVHDIAVTRGDCGCHPNIKQAYYLPMPESHLAEQADSEFAAATQQFQEYVRCRWPIHVFQVDPVTEDQNVSESSVLSRELAIAAALGLSSGRLGIAQASQFVRQYQEEISTVGLNRTISGFSHGSDTFGWIFRPRVQTHPGRGNIAALGETLVGRSADANLRDAAIEPGMRECTAIVLMPSFVPYCDFDVSTGWFRLDNPRSTELTTHAALKLSRSVKQMQDCALQCVQCAHLYRDGETDRLLNRVTQLERQLPLQSMRVQIPYENTLGGFELFSNGVTDLAPELVGWYGAPGIVVGPVEGCWAKNCTPGTGQSRSAATPHASGTTLFLVGGNFSVHETRIIAGGVEIPAEHVQMISREVLQVTIPVCVGTVELDDFAFVDIHASTPYGVTGHLHVPAVRKTKEPERDEQLAATQKRIEAIESRLASSPFNWVQPPVLPVVTSYQPVPVRDGQTTTHIQRSCIGLGNLPPDFRYRLAWPELHLAPANSLNVVGPAGIVGQFSVNGQPVGGTFWIGNVAALDVLNQSSFEIQASALVESLKQPIRDYLPPDKTGNLETLEVLVKTFVVFTEPDGNGNLRMISGPVETGNQIPLLLIRRVNPPSSQQCVEPLPPTTTPEDISTGAGNSRTIVDLPDTEPTSGFNP